MYNDSRKAQHNSFAHHRADLLFAGHLAETGDGKQLPASVHEGHDPADGAQSFRQRVSAGILGFVPAVVPPAR